MLTIRIFAWIISLGMIVSGTGAVFSQPYPNKPLRILTSPIGGSGDFTSRLIAAAISGPLGQPVIVDNRPTVLVPEIVAKAPPDGYTIFTAGGSLWIGALLQPTSYDVVRDFAPITLSLSSPDVLVANPSFPANSVKELIALAKAKPGELNYGSGPAGSSGHLAMELLKSIAGVNIVRVIYPGSGAQILAVISGEMPMTFADASAAAPHIKSGKVKALAIARAQPSARFPGLPTVAESVPGFEPVAPSAYFAPAKTPAAIISRLNQEIVRALNQADVKEKLANTGAEVIGSSPEQAAAAIKSDIARFGKLIKDAGIKAN